MILHSTFPSNPGFEFNSISEEIKSEEDIKSHDINAETSAFTSEEQTEINAIQNIANEADFEKRSNQADSTDQPTSTILRAMMERLEKLGYVSTLNAELEKDKNGQYKVESEKAENGKTSFLFIKVKYTILAQKEGYREQNFSFNRVITTNGKNAEECISTASKFKNKVCTDATIQIYQSKRTLKGHTRPITALVTLPESRLASGSEDTTIRIWDSASGTCDKVLLGHTDGITALTVLPDGRLASASDSTIRIWNIFKKGVCEKILQSEISYSSASLPRHVSVYCLTSLSNGQLVSGGREWLMSGKGKARIFLWNISFWGTSSKVFSALGESVNALARLANERLASGSNEGTIQIWDMHRGICEQVLTGHSHRITSLTPLSSNRLSSGSLDADIRYWDLDRGECKKTLSGCTDRITSLIVFKSWLLAGTKDSTLRLLLLNREACVGILSGHTAEVNALALLPYEKVASGGADNTIHIWDMQSILSIGKKEGEGQKIKNANIAQENSTKEEHSEQNTLIDRKDWMTFQRKLKLYESHSPTNLKDLQETFMLLQAKLDEPIGILLSVNDQQTLADKLSRERAAEAEREFIKRSGPYSEYFQSFDTHFSAIMMASFAVGSNYIDVNKGSASHIAGWAEKLVTTVFPRAKIIMSAITSGVEYIDKRERELFLKEIRIFGGNMMEGIKLGQEVALLLTRAYFHADQSFNLQGQAKKQAEKDCEKILETIASEKTSHPRDEKTAHELFLIVWGNRPYNTSWMIPCDNSIQKKNSILPSSLIENKTNKETVIPSTTSSNFQENSLDVLKQQIADLQQQMTFTVQQDHLMHLKSEVKHLQGRVEQLDPTIPVTNENGNQLQIQISSKSRSRANTEVSSINGDIFIDRLDRETGYAMQHLQEVTQEVISLREEIKTLTGQDYAELKKTLQLALREGITDYRNHHQNHCCTLHGDTLSQQQCISLEEQTARRTNLIEVLNDLIAHFAITIHSNKIMRNHSLDTCIIKAIERNIENATFQLLKKKMEKITLSPKEKNSLSAAGTGIFRSITGYRLKREILKRALIEIRDDLSIISG